MIKKSLALVGLTLSLSANAAILDLNYNVAWAGAYGGGNIDAAVGDILRITNISSSSYNVNADSFVTSLGEASTGPDEFNVTGITSGSFYDHTIVGPDDFNLAIIFQSTGNGSVTQPAIMTVTVSSVPVPAAAWLFGSALIGLAGIKRKK